MIFYITGLEKEFRKAKNVNFSLLTLGLYGLKYEYRTDVSFFADWGSIATINSREPMNGFPFSNIISFRYGFK